VVATLAVTRLLRHQIASLIAFLMVAGLAAVLVFAPETVREVFVTLFRVMTGQ